MTIEEAAEIVKSNAERYQSRYPSVSTLLKEIAEYAAAMEGRQEHSPVLELVQIGGIILNMLKTYNHQPVLAIMQERYAEENRRGDNE